MEWKGGVNTLKLYASEFFTYLLGRKFHQMLLKSHAIMQRITKLANCMQLYVNKSLLKPK